MTMKRAPNEIQHIPKYISLATADCVNRSTERVLCQNDVALRIHVALRIPGQLKDTSKTRKSISSKIPN
jgi:hypothetical protein